MLDTQGETCFRNGASYPTDETYVGGKLRKGGGGPRPKGPLSGGQKMVVYTLVSRDGEARSQLVPDGKAETLQGIMRDEVEGTAHIMTDGSHAYWGADAYFRSHESVDHGSGEYVRGIVHTNFAESFFSLLKRGILGTFHHVSRQHIQRYLEEFDFRWNRRDVSDQERFVDQDERGKAALLPDAEGSEGRRQRSVDATIR